MAYEQFITKNFMDRTLAIIEHAQDITEDYKRQGFTLTLRQLFYQFVARDLLPNKQSEYKRLGSIIDDARQAGLLDWSLIEDRTRNVKKLSVWDSPDEIVAAVARQYREDLWADQNIRPEVWIEKDALVGVVEPVCERWRVPYFACRGYTSQSEAYSAGKRFKDTIENDQVPVILHLGDHDPSGLHMTVDNGDRVSLFAGQKIEVIRLALNMDQIRQYNPPPNPAKDTDARFEGYAALYGKSSWELDALNPVVIDRIVERAIEQLIDKTYWDASLGAEQQNKDRLQGVSDNWQEVVEYIENMEY